MLQSPLVTSHAGVAVAACGAVANLAVGNAENKAKLGAAGVCEGGYPLDACAAAATANATNAAFAVLAAAAVAGLLLLCFFFAALLVTCFCFNSSSAAVKALLQSPLVTSNAGAAEAACRAVANFAASSAEDKAKLGAAGVCEGGYPG